MAEKRGEVMFVMSQLDFENYLSEPCYSGAVSQMKRPANLRGQKLDKGDFDVLIVHRNYGLCAGEIKSVGFNAADRKLSQQQIQDEVLKVLRKMLKLQKTGTGKTLTAVIMGVKWMRRNKTVNILSGDEKSRAVAHHIKQQLEETARLVIGPQAASRVRLHLVDLDKKRAVDKLEVGEAYSIQTGDVPKYTAPAAPLPADGPRVLYVPHKGPGHEEEYTRDCERCGREVGRILTRVLHVGQSGNPSSSTTTTLQYRDVFVLSLGDLHDDGHVTHPANGVVSGLRQAGVPLLELGALLEDMLCRLLACAAIALCRGGQSELPIAFGFGLSIMALIQMIGHVSGGHINPAVTIAMAVAMNISIVRAILYVVAQIIGAIIGGFILKGVTPDTTAFDNLAVTNVNAELTVGQGVGVEIILTFVLVSVIFGTTDPSRPSFGSPALLIGLTVTVLHLAGVYWVGPILGGILAAASYKLIICPYRNTMSMEEALQKMLQDENFVAIPRDYFKDSKRGKDTIDSSNL
nr:hypothetical protein BaRGS_003070 [Batillaria attramentaria]